MVRGALLAVTVGLSLSGAQLAISGASTDIEAASGANRLAYDLDQRDTHDATLVVRGTSSRQDIWLVPVEEAASQVPEIQGRASIGPSARSYDLYLLGAPGTYKLQIPGQRSFGLVNLGR